MNALEELQSHDSSNWTMTPSWVDGVFLLKFAQVFHSVLPNWAPQVAKIFGRSAFLEDDGCGEGRPCKWASYRGHHLATAMLRAEAQ